MANITIKDRFYNTSFQARQFVKAGLYKAGNLSKEGLCKIGQLAMSAIRAGGIDGVAFGTTAGLAAAGAR